MILRHLDLFSGIGGFALAASWAGFSTVGFSEIDLFCSKVLRKHWPNIPNFGDVRSVPTMSQITLITGGFPCQPFSTAGKRKGKDDERYLWPDFLRIIRNIQPRWIVAENVTGIVNMELDQILDDLENENYNVESYIIPASAVGAPHRRERVWIVANALRERRNHGIDLGKARDLQIHWERDVTAMQTGWANVFPQSWASFDFKEWLRPIADAYRVECDKRTENNEAVTERLERTEFAAKIITGVSTPSRHENQPPIPRVDDGIPNIVDRNKALGNAIVPQVIYPILRLIALTEVAYAE